MTEKKWRELWIYDRFSGERACLEAPIKCDEENNPSWTFKYKVIEHAAYQAKQAEVDELVEVLSAVINDVDTTYYIDPNDYPLEYNNKKRAESILAKHRKGGEGK